MNKSMYIFIGITDWVGAGRLCIVKLTASSDRCNYRHGKQSAKPPTIQYSNAHIRGGSISTLYMVDWNHRFPNSGTIFQYLWTDRSSFPLIRSDVRERLKQQWLLYVGITCVWLSKFYTSIQANSCSCIMWTIVTGGGGMRTYSTSIYINK